MSNPTSLITLLLFLPLPTILLGTVAAVFIRRRKPEWLSHFFMLYFGFLCGVLLCLLLSSLTLTSAVSGLTRMLTAAAAEVVGVMGILKLVVVAIGGFSIAIGAFTLFATWFSPKLLESSFVRKLTVGRMEPIRRNHVLIAIWGILLGAYLVLFATDHQLMGFIALTLWLPFGVALLMIGIREQTKQV